MIAYGPATQRLVMLSFMLSEDALTRGVTDAEQLTDDWRPDAGTQGGLPVVPVSLKRLSVGEDAAVEVLFTAEERPPRPIPPGCRRMLAEHDFGVRNAVAGPLFEASELASGRWAAARCVARAFLDEADPVLVAVHVRCVVAVVRD
ncbi:hypothetical protein G3I59_32090 [Amycolatopsis rubida]|uniref:Uncharacterized protein n=1 Tax=Amycolatopsis rubida TaxID=112413 RepID=A0ABX0BRP1_9PSEU|nr:MULTISPECIES: hypothetical protein [Amycolatopsis]MYW90518.1 hypothetical protein [Amycolatopsis rubida]MYW95114.1 hypothetical protein [Amycolatopsis rubida]NEC55498.1 hypothetical protein [Amycolatopsis rubida]NEC60101.1 hypothetical protein [Amycolatopsis rubida]OAP24986.1 hypothetical protein A4R44_04055 [Amycolatopsis sp. M39]